MTHSQQNLEMSLQKPSHVVYAFHLSPWNMEAGDSGVQGHSQLDSNFKTRQEEVRLCLTVK